MDSYSTIWEGEVTKTNNSDHKRVVTALKNIAEGIDLATYMDIDNLLRYMAVHVFSVNEDSLSGMMAHNYYLYESDGCLNIIPWDYNLALGGMSGNDATSVVNEAIDEAFAGTNFFDTLMDDEQYHAQYYNYLQQLVEEYIFGGGFDEFYERTRSQIDSLVEADPNAFYSYDEYLTAVETLYEVVQLRGESIRGQLDGTIPSLSSEQRSSDALIDASHIDLSVMGSMSMGDGLWNVGTDDSAGGGSTVDNGSEIVQPNSATMPSSQPVGGEMPEDIDFSQISGGELPENFDPSQFGSSSAWATDDFASEENAQEDTEAFTENLPNSGSSAGGNAMGGMLNWNPGAGSSISEADNFILYGVCFAVLIAALLFAKLYRRKPKRR